LRKKQKTLDPKQLVFIDETAATTKMTRLYGRAPQGKRLIDKVPHGHWKTTTFICGLGYDRVAAPFVLDGPMDGTHFLAYVEQILAPTLKKGQIVFLDNVSTHKVDGVEEAIEARGARAVFLPAYSPVSIPSNNSSQDSNRSYAKRRRALLRNFEEQSTPFSTGFPKKSAKLISQTRDTPNLSRNALALSKSDVHWHSTHRMFNATYPAESETHLLQFAPWRVT
jgi:transposase